MGCDRPVLYVGALSPPGDGVQLCNPDHTLVVIARTLTTIRDINGEKEGHSW